MTVDRCDFQVPPAVPGWHGILTEAGSKAALWNGTAGRNIPSGYARSMKVFSTAEAALGAVTTGFDPAMKFAAGCPYAAKRSCVCGQAKEAQTMTTAIVAMPISVAYPAICTQSHDRRSIAGTNKATANIATVKRPEPTTITLNKRSCTMGPR